MRWSGQEITVEQGDALPGLAKLSNLVRSVQTPEFAGITFHEVLAKSALNHVPGASALPFGWTVNPYRGCSHACTYCVSPETLVLMGDGRQKPMWAVNVGDEIYGTDVQGSYRRYVKTTVRAKWSTRKRGHRVTLGDGTEIVASGNHRFLSDRGWKHVRGSMNGSEQRPYLTPNNKLMGFGLNGLTEEQQPPFFDANYRRGYLTGIIRGDGMIFHKTYSDARRDRVIHRFRLALADVEALNRSRAFLSDEGIGTNTRLFVGATATRRSITAIHTATRTNVEKIEGLIGWPESPTDSWRAGYLAGVFDAEGSCSKGVLRISNKDPEILRHIRTSMDALHITHVQEPANSIGVSNVRVVGGLPMRSRFFNITGPAITRKLDIEGRAVKSDADLRIVSIEDLGVEMDMIDITTGTGDFIANGVISHNCFARNTHTYLDLDAGKDFDSQIIVKVNVAEVLGKELSRSSWARHPVALGTNTDPYQRAEGRYRLMPGIIAALAASDTPFSILTKGTLLRRDLPLLQAAAERVPVDLAMSIAIFDDELQQSVEPGTPSTAARLATVKAAREAGLPCAVFLMPVLPHLTDSIEHLDRAFGMIAESGASSVAYTALHLRPGAREWYAAWLAREHPDLVPRYKELYGGASYALKEYRTWLAGRVKPLLHKHGLDRQTLLDPATGVPRAGAIRDAALAGLRPGASADAGLLAAELSPQVAAAIQPTLF
ncbi:intein-containing Rv2578c family radical SAM protein [soil metagenome]